MPVLRSVELNVVLWAKAEMVFEGEQGGHGEERAQRERSFGAGIFFISLLVRQFILFLLAAHAANHA